MNNASPNPYATPITITGAIAETMVRTECGTTHRLIAQGGTVADRVESLTNSADRKVSELFRKGLALVRCVDGALVWRERVPLFDGSADTWAGRYTWNDDGDRVRCLWVEHTKTTNDTRTQRQLRRVWVSIDEVDA